MPADTYSVSYITNTMRGAPVINGNTPGCLISTLDALLVTGWGLAAPTSINVSAGVATAVFANTTAWEIGAVIEVSDATPATLNGRARVLSASSTQLTFTTAAADGSYSGAGIKYASANWEKIFSGTNKAVYRSSDTAGSRCYLRVDDSHNQWARVRAYEGMSDIDTGTRPFPTDAQMSGGGYWHKGYSVNTVAVSYVLAADSRALVAAIANGMSYDQQSTVCDIRGFGDPLALNPLGDPYASFLSARGSDNSSVGSGVLSGSTSDSGTAGFCVSARPQAGVGDAKLQRTFPLTGRENDLSGACSLLGAAPSSVDGQIKTSRVVMRDQDPIAPPRSYVPGCYYIPQANVVASLSTGFSQNTGSGEMAGRSMVTVLQGVYVTSPPSGAALIDVTGPWR